ncbi:MAG TPA: hypothetical protein DEH78_06395 [Solibacterales bacterium]|nr:hypothetical protein [Bryobacterales bacterium]
MYWLEQTSDDVPAADSWLSGAEQRRLASFSVAKRREDWRLGRWTAKRTVAAVSGCALEAVEIVAAADGAPEAFVAGAAVPPAISLSHSGGRALCVAGPPGSHPGCDIEAAEPRSVQFVADYFTEAERRLVARRPEHDWLPTLLWSAKESALKALREGLRLDTRSVEVHLEFPGGELGRWQPLCTYFAVSGLELPGWWRLEDRLLRTMVGDAQAPVELRLRKGDACHFTQSPIISPFMKRSFSL